ncbi:MAG: A/G-specific adenine glycosylase [Ruminococcaceae bacterium]|nr:A/G-specific adenine glycosylase [Oscillospiraceae bacterium]
MKNKLSPDIVPALLDWYRANKRNLPWRHTKDPYAVWISEIMLQQTRCEAVKPYYHRFLDRLPDVSALAAVPDEELLKLWEGLGYYSRARNLKKAAVQIMERHGGKLPHSYPELLTLAGIGEYTAGAIASIAFDQPVPAVDGNVLRLLSRLTADERDIATPQMKADVKAQIGALIPRDAPGDFNQALIELGATLCGPGHAALCGSCPLALSCHALRLGMTDALPVKKKKAERKILPRTLFILKKGDLTALDKREEKGLLAGMYEIPSCDGHLTAQQTADYLVSLGYTVESVLPLTEAKHVFTHLEWHMKAYLVQVSEGNFHPFHSRQALSALPLPGAFSAYKDYLLQ